MEDVESSWRKHLEDDLREGGYRIRGTEIHADQVLMLIAGGASVDQILAKNPSLSREAILACIECAQEALEKQRVMDAIREGVADSRAGRVTPHEDVLDQFEREFGFRRPS